MAPPKKGTLLALNLVFVVGLGAKAADTFQFTASLTASNGAPPVGSVTLLQTANHLAYTAVDTPSPLVIRGPASPGVVGPVIFTLDGGCGADEGCLYHGERSLSAAEIAALQGGLWFAESEGRHSGRLLLDCVSRFTATNAIDFSGVLVGRNPQPIPRFIRWGRIAAGLTARNLSYRVQLPAIYGPYQGFIVDPFPFPSRSPYEWVMYLGTLECVLNSSPLPPDAEGLELLQQCEATGSFCVPEQFLPRLLGGELALLIFPTDTTFIHGNVVQGGITPVDQDLDGVPDDRDACPSTPPGAIVNASGCAIEQLCPCAGSWKSHGEFMNCIKQATADFLNAGLITEAQRNSVHTRAAQSDCGKR